VPNTPHVLPLTWRLYRRNSARLLFFSACIAAGVAFLFSVGNLLSAVDRAVAVRARTLMAADVEIAANRPLGQQTENLLRQLETEGVRSTRITSFASMLHGPKISVPVLASVKAVEQAYPFYGDLRIDPPNFASDFYGKPAALIDEQLALRYNLKRGSRLQLGRATLIVAGIVRAEPDRGLSAFNLGPRVFVPFDILDKTELVRFGARLRHRRLLAAPASTDPGATARALELRIEQQLRDPYIQVSSYAASRPSISRVLKRATMFFVLIALVALLLGAVGMAATMSMFLNEQLETVGILRCLGLGPQAIARIYHGLCFAVGLQGGLMGAAGGWVLSVAALETVKRVLGLNMELSPGFSAPALGEALLLSTTLAVGLNATRVRALAGIAPLQILRERTRRLPASARGLALSALIGLGLLVAYAYWKSNSIEVARSFAFGLMGAAGLVGLAVAGILKLLDIVLPLFAAQKSLALRHGLRQLARNPARAWVFLFTLSLGFSLLGALAIVHNSLRAEILLGQAEKAPDLFLVDIQKSQLAGVRKMVQSHGSGAAEYSPLIRARLTHINKLPIGKRDPRELTVEQRSRQRFLTREYNLTYKDQLNSSEKIIAGTLWTPGTQTPQISVEEGFAKRVGVGLGDVLRFDIQGRPISASVTSLRSIDWVSMKPNFFVVFPTQVLQRAPQTFVGSFKIRDRERTARFQSDLLAAYGNVSTIDMAAVLKRVQGVLGVLLAALTGVAWFCVGVGLLVLAGTLSLGRRERSESAALLRALGADQATLMRIDAVELVAIGATTCFLSFAVAHGLGWFISQQMDLQLTAAPASAAWIAFAALSLPPLIGLSVQWRVYRTGVLSVLRREV
jgi:putative ABC transport system permease protein